MAVPGLIKEIILLIKTDAVSLSTEVDRQTLLQTGFLRVGCGDCKGV